MNIVRQFGGWLCTLGLGAGLVVSASASAAQHRPPQSPPPRSAPGAGKAVPRGGQKNDRPPNANGNAAQNAQHSNGSVNGSRVATPPPNVQDRWRNMGPQDRQ